MNDDILVARTQAGDVVALEMLLGRYESNLFQLAQRFVRNEHDAQEVLQDVFVTVWRKLPGFEERSKVGSWLHRVTVNAALMHLRGRKRRLAFEALAQDAPQREAATAKTQSTFTLAIQPDEQLESRELGSLIQEALDRLPLPLRSVFLAREVQGCSTRQTALLLGISDTAVKTRLHRARCTLREKVEGYLLQ